MSESLAFYYTSKLLLRKPVFLDDNKFAPNGVSTTTIWDRFAGGDAAGDWFLLLKPTDGNVSRAEVTNFTGDSGI